MAQPGIVDHRIQGLPKPTESVSNPVTGCVTKEPGCEGVVMNKPPANRRLKLMIEMEEAYKKLVEDEKYLQDVALWDVCVNDGLKSEQQQA